MGSFDVENRAFLSTYDTFDKQANFYTEKVKQLFKKYEIDYRYTDNGVKNNVIMWLSEKKKIFNMLRKHDCWNEEAKAIVFLNDEKREYDNCEFVFSLENLIRCVTDYLSERFHKNMSFISYHMLQLIISNESNVITEKTCSHISRSIESYSNYVNSAQEKMFKEYGKIRSGMKTSKAVGKIFKYILLDDEKSIFDCTKINDFYGMSYNKIYAKMADACNPISIKRITVLSANILDFLLMSNGNSWSSCHYINSHNIFKPASVREYSGSNKAGCLSYSNDDVSMILYTLPDNYHGNQWWDEFKITRQIFAYKNGTLLQSRLYPSGENCELSNQYRLIVQKIISSLDSKPNFWNIYSDIEKINDFVDTRPNTFHYPDYSLDKMNPTLSVNKDNEKQTPLIIGGRSYCVDCGSLRTQGNSYSNSLQCCACSKNEDEEDYNLDEFDF